MTPERKKKLRTLLRKKAAEELKKEQERKAAERQRVISERYSKAYLVRSWFLRGFRVFLRVF